MKFKFSEYERHSLTLIEFALVPETGLAGSDKVMNGAYDLLKPELHERFLDGFTSDQIKRNFRFLKSVITFGGGLPLEDVENEEGLEWFHDVMPDMPSGISSREDTFAWLEKRYKIFPKVKKTDENNNIDNRGIPQNIDPFFIPNG